MKTAVVLLAAALQAGSAMAQLFVEPAGIDKVKLDGVLDEPVWSRARAFDGFRQFEPYTGGSAPQAYRTVVRLASDDAALYVAIEAFDPEPQGVRMPFVRRDKVLSGQDHVVVYVDAVGNGAAAQWFRVAASGAMADGLHTAATDAEDFSPDYRWDSASRVSADRYTVEIRVPYRSLRLAHGGNLPWRMQFERHLPREQNYQFVSTELSKESSSRIAQMQPVEMPGVRHGWIWEAGVTLTARRTRESPDDAATRSSAADAGLDLKVIPHAGWVVDATLRPDFSQIELDVPQLSRNRQFALSLVEKRPFFLESVDLAQTPTTALYSRSITEPRWGARVTYRGDALAGTALTVDDKGGGIVLLPTAFRTDVARQPASTATTGRLRWDRGDMTLGLLAADKHYDGAGYNRVAGSDAMLRLPYGHVMRAQALMSETTAWADGQGGLASAPTRRGYLGALDWVRSSAVSNLVFRYREATDSFRNDNGLVTQAGHRRLSASVDRQFRSSAGVLQEITPYFDVVHVRTRDTGESVSGEYHPGLHLAGARGLDLNLEWRPGNKVRAAAGSQLHTLRQGYVSFSISPNASITNISAELTAGDQLDVAADRVRSGWVLSSSSRLRLSDRIELEPRFDQSVLRDDDGRRTQTETAAQLLGVVHWSAADALRVVLQRSSFSLADGYRERVDTASLVMAHRRNALQVFYVGITRRNERADTSSRATEVFAKAQLGF